MTDQPIRVPDEEVKPEIFDLSREEKSFKFTRRDFLKSAGVITAGAAALSSCGPGIIRVVVTATPEQAEKPPTIAPTATSPPTEAPTRTVPPSRTPSPTPMQVIATTVKQGINLRTGPATVYMAIGSLAANVQVTAIARLADSSWLKVLVSLDDLPVLQDKPIAQNNPERIVPGWIRTDLLNILSGNIEDLPVEAEPGTPTPLPNQKPTGKEGITYKYTDLYGNTYTFTLPCGAPIPAGAICTCNCVVLCSCDGYVAPTLCSCDSHHGGGTICTCNLVTYWYPN